MFTLFNFASPSTNLAAYTAGEKIPNFDIFPPIFNSERDLLDELNFEGVISKPDDIMKNKANSINEEKRMDIFNNQEGGEEIISAV